MGCTKKGCTKIGCTKRVYKIGCTNGCKKSHNSIKLRPTLIPVTAISPATRILAPLGPTDTNLAVQQLPMALQKTTSAVEEDAEGEEETNNPAGRTTSATNPKPSDQPV